MEFDMTILETVKIKNLLDDLVNAKSISLYEFYFTINKMNYEVESLIVQTSNPHNESVVRVKDNNDKYYVIKV